MLKCAWYISEWWLAVCADKLRSSDSRLSGNHARLPRGGNARLSERSGTEEGAMCRSRQGHRVPPTPSHQHRGFIYLFIFYSINIIHNRDEHDLKRQPHLSEV